MKKDINVDDFEEYKLDSIHAGSYCELQNEGCLLKEEPDSVPGNVKMYRLYNNSEKTTETIKVCSKCESNIKSKLKEIEPR